MKNSHEKNTLLSSSMDKIIVLLNLENIYSGSDAFNEGDWKRLYPKDLPLQRNGYDCGVFCIKYAHYFAKGEIMDFKQEDMKYYRSRIVWEILNSEIFWP